MLKPIEIDFYFLINSIVTMAIRDLNLEYLCWKHQDVQFELQDFRLIQLDWAQQHYKLEFWGVIGA